MGEQVRFVGAPDLEASRARVRGFWNAPGFTLPEGTHVAGDPDAWCVRCERADGSFHGPATFWRRSWPSRSPAWTVELHGTWRDGVRHGREVARRGEVLCWEGEFVDGVKHGEWRTFDKGALLLSHHFERGVLRQTVTATGRVFEWRDGALESSDPSPPFPTTGELADRFQVDGRTVRDLTSDVGPEPKVLLLKSPSHLPPALWKLRSLRELHIESGDITRLPPELGALENLEVLVLHTMPIEQLPPELGLLRRLRRLTVAFTKLVGFPRELGQLHALERLDVTHSPVVALPDSLGSCSSLKSLALENTRIEALPETLGETPLDGLAVTHRSHTSDAGDGTWGQLRSLPASLTRCPLRGGFSLLGQLVTELPDGLGAGTHASVVNCPLLRVPRLRVDSPRADLKFVEVAIETLPEWLGELKAHKLSIERNPLVAWPAVLEQRRLVKSALARFKKVFLMVERIRARDAALAARRAGLAAKPKPRPKPNPKPKAKKPKSKSKSKK